MGKKEKTKGKKVKLKAFMAGYAPTTNFQRNVLIAYFLREHRAKKKINAEQVAKRYQRLGWEIADVERSLRDTAKRKGWLEVDEAGNISLTTAGEEALLNEIPRTSDDIPF